MEGMKVSSALLYTYIGAPTRFTPDGTGQPEATGQRAWWSQNCSGAGGKRNYTQQHPVEEDA